MNKEQLFNVAIEQVEVEGESYAIKQMSAIDYTSFSTMRDEIDEDGSISDGAKNIFQSALMVAFSLVDDEGNKLFSEGEYGTIAENMRIATLMGLASKILDVNGMGGTEEDTAKNS